MTTFVAYIVRIVPTNEDLNTSYAGVFPSYAQAETYAETLEMEDVETYVEEMTVANRWI